MAAFPTLIAASADPTLIATSLARENSGYQRSSFGFSSSGQNSQSADEVAYQQMARPCTRGEIARRIIQQALPSENTDWSSLSPEEFQLMAHDWWLAHKDKDFANLAIHFLEEGDDEQRQIALQGILKSGDESAYPAIESFILESSSLSNQVALVKKYLKRRRSKGREFHDTYVAKLREEYESNLNGRSGEEIEDYLKRITSSLSVLVNDISPEKIMAEISSGKRSAEEGFPLLQVAIGEGAYLKHLGSILTFSSELKEPEDRLLALSQIQNWIYRDAPNNNEIVSEDETLTDYQKNVRELAIAHLETWQKFLTKTEPLTLSEERSANLQSPPSEAHYAAMVMMGIHYPESNRPLRILDQVASTEEFWNLYLEQMTKFTKTKEAPIIPASELVPDERREEIITKVKGLPTAEIVPYRKSLNLSERLALIEDIEALEELPEQIAALSKVCQKINWDRGRDISQETRERIEATVIGQQLSLEMVVKTFETLTKEEAGLILIFQTPSDSLSGPAILAWTTKASNGWLENQAAEELAELDGKKHQRLETILAFGIDGDSDGPLKATRFLPSTEDKIFDEVFTKVLPLFEPSDGEDRGRQGGFALATQSFAGLQSESEEEDE